jgi:hypothetical protein
METKEKKWEKGKKKLSHSFQLGFEQQLAFLVNEHLPTAVELYQPRRVHTLNTLRTTTHSF